MQQTLAKGTPLKTLFTSTDEAFHAKLRRSVSSAYAMTSLVQFEPLVDSTTTEFLKQLKQRYADKPDSHAIVDFGAWLQYYAFDVICELTYSKRLGFVERGQDVENIISSLEWLLNYAAVVSTTQNITNLLTTISDWPGACSRQAASEEPISPLAQ